VLGQAKVTGKSDEITTTPKLLEVLSIKRSFATINAMDCQTDIAEKIIEKEAGYFLDVKNIRNCFLKKCVMNSGFQKKSR
jgi:predicted transposase YbfD/YdcC